MLCRAALVLPLAAGAAAHGLMTLPSARNGGSLAIAGVEPVNSGYFTTGTNKKGPDTLPAGFGTVLLGTSPNPWRAPGTAPVSSPCGQGPKGDGVDLPPTKRTVWQAGTTVKAGWAIFVNHGGGYAYRLCPATEKLTEACFQKHYIPFADNTTIIHWVSGREESIPNDRAVMGGAEWKRNPIPNHEGGAPFSAPCTGCTGDMNTFSLVDQLMLPANLAPGDYVLSWRWDCEVTPQVWLNCADIKISSA